MTSEGERSESSRDESIGNTDAARQAKAAIEEASDKGRELAHKGREFADRVVEATTDTLRDTTDTLRDESHEDSRNYEDRTRDELYSLAADRDIAGRSNMRKAELIDALRADG